MWGKGRRVLFAENWLFWLLCLRNRRSLDEAKVICTHFEIVAYFLAQLQRRTRLSSFPAANGQATGSKGLSELLLRQSSLLPRLDQFFVASKFTRHGSAATLLTRFRRAVDRN